MTAPALQSTDELQPDEESLARYAAISRTAVAALMLGVASALVLTSPLLIVVPLAAAAVAVIALRQIAASSGQLKGQWPATVGLCLATLFLGWGVTQQASRQAMLADRAEALVDHWLSLVKDGKLQQADQWRRPIVSRIEGDAALADLYGTDKEAANSLQMFFASEPLKSFQAAGPDVSWRLEGIAAQSRTSDSEELVLKYLFKAADGSERPMWISISRRLEGLSQRPNWEVQSVEAALPFRWQ
jgi:hypothetical protein